MTWKHPSNRLESVFYRSEHNEEGEGPMELNFEGLEIQKWNLPTDRAQIVNKKNGIIYLVIMLTPQVMVIKMSKMADFLYFLLMPAKNQSQFGQNIYVHLRDLT